MATTLQSNEVTVLLQPQVTNPENVRLSVPTILYVQQDFLVILSEFCIDQKKLQRSALHPRQCCRMRSKTSW